MIDWKIDSWRQFPIKQVPEYSDVSNVTRVEKELSVRPPLVFAEEARRLRKKKGRTSTILTGMMGDDSEATLGRKTLLG